MKYFQKEQTMANPPITVDERQMHFEIHADGEIAFIEYRFFKDDIALMHTLVPDKISGKGIASSLAKYALEWAKEHHKKVIIYCPFVSEYLKKHPEYDNLIDKSDR